MVRDNKIQAATLFQPFYEEAMAKGDLKILFSDSDIYGGPTDYVFMAFDDKFLKANPKAVRDYIEDYLHRRQLGARQPRRGGAHLCRAVEAAGAGGRFATC